MVDGQFQGIREQGLSGPGWSHQEKLCIGLTQFGQNLGEELIRRKSVCPQILPWEREGIHHQGPGVSLETQRLGVWGSTWWKTSPHGRNMCLETSTPSDHSMGRVRSWQERRLVITFIFPGMWTAHKEICSLETSWNRSSISFQREKEQVLPSLLMLDTRTAIWRKGEPLKGFKHCSNLQQVDMEPLFWWLPLPLEHVSL